MNESDRKEIGERLVKAARLPRRHANFYNWPDKTQKELFLCSLLVEHLEKKGETGFKEITVGSDPPDCLVRQGDVEIAVEITELVDRGEIERQIKMDQPEIDQQIARKIAYQDPTEWTPEVLSERLNERIAKKDDPRGKEGHKYSRYVLLIHTDEPELQYDAFQKVFNPTKLVTTSLINEIYILFSYDPRIDDKPVLRIR